MQHTPHSRVLTHLLARPTRLHSGFARIVAPQRFTPSGVYSSRRASPFSGARSFSRLRAFELFVFLLYSAGRSLSGGSAYGRFVDCCACSGRRGEVAASGSGGPPGKVNGGAGSVQGAGMGMAEPDTVCVMTGANEADGNEVDGRVGEGLREMDVGGPCHPEGWPTGLLNGGA